MMHQILRATVQVVFLSFLPVTLFGKFVILSYISGVLFVAMMKLTF
jgi:hypothetical protein